MGSKRIAALLMMAIVVLDVCVAQHVEQAQARASEQRRQRDETRSKDEHQRNETKSERELKHELRTNRTRAPQPARRRAGPRPGKRITTGNYMVNGYLCPTTVTPLDPGDLFTLIDTTVANMTYVLSSGAYTWSNEVDLSGQGDLCILGATATGVTITGPTTGSGTMLFIDGNDARSPSLGLQNLTIVSSGSVDWGVVDMESSSGYIVKAYLENVVVDGFNCNSLGCGVYLSSGMGYYKDCIFSNNAGSSHAGAIDFVEGDLPCGGVVQNTKFLNNTAAKGGAIHVHGSCSLTLIDCEYNGNVATGSQGGGAMFLNTFASDTSTIDIYGSFCGQYNQATDPVGHGGFAYVMSGSTLTFHDPSQQAVSSNTPDDVFIEAGGLVSSTKTPGTWTPPGGLPGSFYMFGTIQQCALNFTTGVNQYCNACGVYGWNAALCVCDGPDVAIGLVADTTTTGVGAQLNFTVTLTNVGSYDSPPTNGFTLEVPGCIYIPDTLTPEPLNDSPPVTCTISRALGAGAASNLTCTVDDATLMVADVWSYNLPLDASAPCNATVTASLTQPDLISTNNVASFDVTVLPCSTGVCCNADGTFKPSTTVCRPSNSPCVRSAKCTGASPDCPTSINLPDGQACPWVAPERRRWHEASAHMAAVGGTALGAAFADANPGSTPEFTLAFTQAAPDAHTTRQLQADGGDNSALLDPCVGECVAGKCLLVFPFRQPHGGCCRVLTTDDFYRHHASPRDEEHRYSEGRLHNAYDDEYDELKPHKLSSKVCWQQAPDEGEYAGNPDNGKGHPYSAVGDNEDEGDAN